jgi:hypothetical protein
MLGFAVKTGSSRLENVVAAFAVAPLGGALVVGLIGYLFGAIMGGENIVGTIVAGGFLATAGVGYAVAIILGIPGFLLFWRLRWTRGAHWVLLCAAVGAVTGAVAPLILTAFGGQLEEICQAAGVLLIAGAAVGKASGLLFARVIKVRQPAAADIAATFD